MLEVGHSVEHALSFDLFAKQFQLSFPFISEVVVSDFRYVVVDCTPFAEVV